MLSTRCKRAQVIGEFLAKAFAFSHFSPLAEANGNEL